MRMHKERFMLDFRKKKSTKIIKQYFVEDDWRQDLCFHDVYQVNQL